MKTSTTIFKIFRALFFLFILSLCFNCLEKAESTSNQTLKSTGGPLYQDLLIYRQRMEALNAGIYRYTSKDSMDILFEKTLEQLDENMDDRAFYRLIAKLNDHIHDAHTSIRPSKRIRGAAINTKKIFPFDIRYEDDHLLIEKNFSNDSSIIIGSEITSINGRNIKEINSVILLGHTTDGHIKSPKYHVMSDFFWLYYHELVDSLETFQITLKDKLSNKFREVSVDGISSKILLEDYQKNIKYREINLEVNTERSFAILTIPHFLDLGLIEKFRSVFAQLKFEKIKTLIIDIRDNPGGWDELNPELFKYLMKEEFKFYNHFTYIARNKEHLNHVTFDTLDFFSDKEQKAIGKDSLKELFSKRTLSESIEHYINTNPAQGIHKPYDKLVFEGDIYLLFNGGSISSGAEVPAFFKEHNLGILVGDEPNGAVEGVTAGIMGELVLPNSQIRVIVPLISYYSNVSPPKQKGRGAMPDYYIKQTLDDAKKGKDTALEFIFKHITDKTPK
ncbi:S41 family peptidase [Muricauda sp. 2012CJ35-5]|uniref:S41 family peptidase n=1 Tax=Flagellimonas spongiicola TaxID=2942208 RepID=A0ABT0PSZ4_9FLAO|nr:S41 family peptidase [Allomuricauda spongiicola]MCL6274503.1 S41 family peptidase [Allomuricauda spongiicola]